MMLICFISILIAEFQCNSLVLPCVLLYVFKSIILKRSLWAFHQAAKGVHGTWLPSTHSTQKSTLEGLKMGNSGGVPYTHTHTHTHTLSLILTDTGGPLPWNQSPPGSPVLWASPGMETTPDSQQNTTSFKPEKHDLLPACFQFQHVSRRCLEKVSLYEYLEKADHKIRETWYFGFVLFCFPFDEENSGLLLLWANHCTCYSTCIYCLRRKMS